ncbi:MAG: tRNA (adenosine(37)-N6)-dimethylallyltransferase MiaA [Kiloniellales bacterium]
MAQGSQDRGAPAILVAGPTASGKSGLALAIAEAFAGTVINADALQVYRDLRILSARPGPDEERAAPHRLYGILPASERCSAGAWRALALAEIAAAQAAGRLPVLAGGSGLYIKALEQGLAAIPQVPEALRATGEELYARLGGAAFRAALVARDPASARLAANDRQRLVRAWEVLEASGRSLASWQAGQGSTEPGLRWLRLVLLPPRERLYEACERRFRAMVGAGALDEVRALLALGLDPRLPAMKAVGVPEFGRHLAGAIDLETAIAQGEGATRRYAKRQTTWLRGQMGLKQAILPGGAVAAEGGDRLISAANYGGPASQTRLIAAQYSERLKESIFSIIRRFLLTGRG